MSTKPIIMEGHKVVDHWILAPKADILIPQFGRLCYGPSFWFLTENDEVLFYKSYASPQCNIDVRILEKAIHIPFPTKIELIEMAFIPHRCSDYF